ncbi:hypothetical protein [Planococcus salinarum]|uniref:hypothetical protein n=1 Tax=Planococcus salinarum TaxID=622695 RepID=UPI000E3DB795|nr:hypothetical protein [Planococcus salinarum]TAA71934.1 hypothetical protein D2909_08915 [Planococcus salinarum]
MKHTYIRLLPEEIQSKICNDVYKALYEEGFRGEELEESIDTAMASKLFDLEDTIDISKYITNNA